MSGKKYFECAICGTKYEACYSCNRKNASLSWKNVCDTAEHYKIFQIVNGYTAGVYDVNEAAKKLENVDLSDLDSFRDNIKEIIVGIQNEAKPKPARRSRKKKVQDEGTVTEHVVEEHVDAVAEDDVKEPVATTAEKTVGKPTLESATTII